LARRAIDEAAHEGVAHLVTSLHHPLLAEFGFHPDGSSDTSRLDVRNALIYPNDDGAT
jgi:hypothetical protein